MFCPKCGHERNANDDPEIPDHTCPACGIVYAKFINRATKVTTEHVKSQSTPIPLIRPSNSSLDKKNNNNSFLKGLLIVALLWTSISIIKNNRQNNEQLPAAKVSRHEQRAKTPQLSAAEKEQQRIIKDQQCKQDLKCIGSQLSYEHGEECKKLIESRSKYSFKWTDGFLESKFTRYAWKNLEHDIVSIGGDSIQFQNGFGAMRDYYYICHITLSGNIIGVDVAPGRF